MKKSLLLFLLSLSCISLLSCSKNPDKTENKQQNYTNTITIDSPQKEESTTITLNAPAIYPNIFQTYGDNNIFIDWRNNNRLSTFSKTISKGMFPNLEIETIYDLSSSYNSIAVHESGIIYTDSGDSGNIHMATKAPNESTKLLEYTGDNFIILENNLYYINRTKNNTLSKYDFDSKTNTALSQNRVEKFIIVGEWIIYQNVSDSYRIYAIKLDGSSNIKLSNSSSESFAFYKNNLVFVNSSDNDNLYLLSINNLEEKKILNNKAEKVSSVNDTLFFINKDDINHLYTLTEDTNLKFTTKQLSSDPVISYYPFNNSILYKRSLSPDSGIYIIENAYK